MNLAENKGLLKRLFPMQALEMEIYNYLVENGTTERKKIADQLESRFMLLNDGGYFRKQMETDYQNMLCGAYTILKRYWKVIKSVDYGIWALNSDAVHIMESIYGHTLIENYLEVADWIEAAE